METLVDCLVQDHTNTDEHKNRYALVPTHEFSRENLPDWQLYEEATGFAAWRTTSQEPLQCEVRCIPCNKVLDHNHAASGAP